MFQKIPSSLPELLLNLKRPNLKIIPNNRDIWESLEMLNVKNKTPILHQWYQSGVFIVNFEQTFLGNPLPRKWWTSEFELGKYKFTCVCTPSCCDSFIFSSISWLLWFSYNDNWVLILSTNIIKSSLLFEYNEFTSSWLCSVGLRMSGNNDSEIFMSSVFFFVLIFVLTFVKVGDLNFCFCLASLYDVVADRIWSSMVYDSIPSPGCLSFDMEIWKNGKKIWKK